jgi:hypothetical protein
MISQQSTGPPNAATAATTATARVVAVIGQSSRPAELAAPARPMMKNGAVAGYSP